MWFPNLALLVLLAASASATRRWRPLYKAWRGVNKPASEFDIRRRYEHDLSENLQENFAKGRWRPTMKKWSNSPRPRASVDEIRDVRKEFKEKNPWAAARMKSIRVKDRMIEDDYGEERRGSDKREERQGINYYYGDESQENRMETNDGVEPNNYHDLESNRMEASNRREDDYGIKSREERRREDAREGNNNGMEEENRMNIYGSYEPGENRIINAIGDFENNRIDENYNYETRDNSGIRSNDRVEDEYVRMRREEVDNRMENGGEAQDYKTEKHEKESKERMVKEKSEERDDIEESDDYAQKDKQNEEDNRGSDDETKKEEDDEKGGNNLKNRIVAAKEAVDDDYGQERGSDGRRSEFSKAKFGQSAEMSDNRIALKRGFDPHGFRKQGINDFINENENNKGDEKGTKDGKGKDLWEPGMHAIGANYQKAKRGVRHLIQ